MPHAVGGGTTKGPVAASGVVLVNAGTATRRLVLSATRDGTARTERLTVEANDLVTVQVPSGGGPLTLELDTAHGEHASVTADEGSLIVVRDGSVLVSR